MVPIEEVKKVKHDRRLLFSRRARTQTEERRRSATRRTALVTVCAAACLLFLGRQPGTQASSVEPTVIVAYESLRAYIGALPGSTLQKGLRTSFVKKLENSEKAYSRGQPCTAGHILNAYLNHATALRTGKGLLVAEDLYNRGWNLLSTLLTSLPEGESCADSPRFGAEPETEIEVSDNTRLRATLTFGQPTLRTVTAGGELFTVVSLPGIGAGDASGGAEEVGKPGVPMTYRFVAFPIGSQPSVQVVQRWSARSPG
jgi:hypothetical protein